MKRDSLINIQNNIDAHTPIKYDNEFEFRGNPFLYPIVETDEPSPNNGTIVIAEDANIHSKYHPVKFIENINLEDKNNFSIEYKFDDKIVLDDGFIFEIHENSNDSISLNDEFVIDNIIK